MKPARSGCEWRTPDRSRHTGGHLAGVFFAIGARKMQFKKTDFRPQVFQTTAAGLANHININLWQHLNRPYLGVIPAAE
ncbi:hypothetical protein ACF0H2_02590 [Serratia marcescens]